MVEGAKPTVGSPSQAGRTAASAPLPRGNPSLGWAMGKIQAGRAELSLGFRRSKGSAPTSPKFDQNFAREDKLLDKDDRYTSPQTHLMYPHMQAHSKVLLFSRIQAKKRKQNSNIILFTFWPLPLGTVSLLNAPWNKCQVMVEHE